MWGLLSLSLSDPRVGGIIVPDIFNPVGPTPSVFDSWSSCAGGVDRTGGGVRAEAPDRANVTFPPDSLTS